MMKAIVGVAFLLAATALGGCEGEGATEPTIQLAGTWYAQQTSEIAWSITLQELPRDSLRGEGWYGATLLKPSSLEAEGVRNGDQVRLRIHRACCASAAFEGNLVSSRGMVGTLVEEGSTQGIPLQFSRVEQ